MTAGSSSRTYGFLFADLRGFTEFVETHGDREAGALLAVFRPLVRSVLAAYDDAEVRTEGAEARTQGDSFYLRFPSVGAAVTCGLEITRAAEEATRARPDRPIRVGVGIHAGETIETDEGLVGSAVNVAARVCSLAKAGEVLVTDTVRSLTRTSLDVSFQPRGTPYLKGVAEPIPLFVVQSGATYPSSTAGPARNPFKGLRPFGMQDRGDFFGRDALTSRLVERLEQVSRVGRLLAVVGPSGSGKSSVVRAGLLPAVGDGVLAGSQDWRIAVMFPGAHPFDELAAALGAVSPKPLPGLAESLQSDGDIGSAVDDTLPGPDSRLLLVIDQFEELFTLVRDDAARSRFIDALCHALAEERGRLLAIITIRADFLDRPLLVPDLGELVRAGLEAVTPMTRGELEAAISKPAEAVGLELEPGLAADVIADVVRQPGALPQLQYALTELFERSNGRRLTRDTYGAIGGVLGALGQRAEETYASFDADTRELARQVLLRLVVPGSGTGATGRRVPTHELQSLAGDPARLAEVVDGFGRWRLLAFDRDAASGQPTVEIAHEALLARWPRLAGWVDEDRDDLWMRQRLDEAAAEWMAADRDTSFLLGGSRLDAFGTWAAATDLRLGEIEQDYLSASIAERERVKADDRAREVHERALERRAATRLRALVGVFAGAALVASLLVALVFAQAETAREDGAIATARELAAASVGNLRTDPSLSMLLAAESARATANRGYITEEAMDALHWALQAAGVAYPLEDAPVTTRAGPDGLRGVYVIAPDALAKLAADHAGRTLTTEECRTYLHTGTCPQGEAAGIGARDLAVHKGSGTVPIGSLTTGSLAGTRASVVSDLPPDLGPMVSTFESETGIIVAEGSGRATDLGSMTTGQLPDIAIVARPGDVAALARQGRLIDLETIVDDGALRADLGSYLVSLGTVGTDGAWPATDGNLFGVPVAAAVGGLVWYPPAAFEEAGYAVPHTWDDLIALSQRMVTDGRTPWCLGVDAGAQSGSSAAGWVEGLVLGGAGPAVYADWGTGALGGETGSRIPFTDFRVRQAFQRFGKLMFGDGLVLGGPGSVMLTPERLAAWPLAKAPDVPSCWLYLGDGTERQDWPEQLSGAIASFPIPPVDARFAGALRGRTYSVIVFHDRPEVRLLARFLLDDSFATQLAQAPDAVGVLPLRPVDPPMLRDDVERTQAALLQAATRDGSFRSNASELMPPQLAAAFKRTMLDYLAERDQGLDRILGDLQAGRTGYAATAPAEALRATVDYGDAGCTYQGPVVIPRGSALTVDFVVSREQGLGTLLLAPIYAGVTWDDVKRAEKHPASRVSFAYALPAAWPDILEVSGTGTAQESSPGKTTFVLRNDASIRDPRDYVVVCLSSDTYPVAATLIRLVTP